MVFQIIAHNLKKISKFLSKCQNVLIYAFNFLKFPQEKLRFLRREIFRNKHMFLIYYANS